MRRTPIDTALSCYMKSFMNDYPFANSLEWFASYYQAYDAICTHWRRILDDKWLDVRYEALVANPEATVHTVRQFLGCQPARPVQSGEQTTSELTPSEIGRWRRYAQQLQPVLSTLHPAGSEH
jgi:hypothetical protein